MLSSCLCILCAVVFYADSASVIDQRQNGEFNVQVDLKNFEIFALLKGNKEEYVDYDYAYDYSEMTIKPLNGISTVKPLNVTSAINNTQNITTAATTTVAANQTITSIQGNTPNDTSSSVASTTTVAVSEPGSSENAGEFTNKYETSTTAASLCKKGFVANPKGDCELKLKSSGNALLKLVKLSQKLKQQRRSRRSYKPAIPNNTSG